MGSLDVLALLPGPSTKPNAGTACLHYGQLLAYGASSAIIVVDVQKLCTATSLVGLHRNASVSALAWHPGLGPRDPKSTALLRLASGDDEGRVAVWNVSTGAAIAALEDPVSAAFPGQQRRVTADAAKPAVQGLAWVTAAPTLLAVLAAPGYLVLWDFKANSVIWRKDLGAAELFTSIQVDPLDRRQFCVCGNKGTFVVLRAVNPAMDKVRQQQYQVDIGKAGGTLQCAFSTTQDLLFVLLQREIIVFDLEYGQPAASTQLGVSRPPFEGLLASYGHAAAGKELQDGGIDVLYCSHTDGSVSIWQRHDKLLTYSMAGLTKLLPPAPKFQPGKGPQLVALAAGLWLGLQPAAAGALDSTITSPAISSMYLRDELTPRPGSVRQLPPEQGSGAAAGAAAAGSGAATLAAPGSSSGNPSGSGGSSGGGNEAVGGDMGTSAAPAGQSGHSVLVMGVCNEGQAWQWQLPLLVGTAEEKQPSPRAQLLGVVQSLSHRVTNFSVCASPVGLPGQPGQVVMALAAATAGGNLELVTLQQGSLAPLHATISASLAAHKSSVPGMRWLGTSPRIASFSSEKTQTGYRNTLLITDVRNRMSIPVRSNLNDLAPIIAVRASPTGRYLLVIFKGMPSEIWAVGGGDKPTRLRQIDLQFTAVEWMGDAASATQADPARQVCRWQPSAEAQAWAANGFPVEVEDVPLPSSPRDDLPDERLAFSLVDGRVGVLAIKGRRIQDTHPKRPVWLPLATGEYRATAVAGWNHLVFFGDGEGGLVKWDTSTGRTFVVETGQGKIHKLYVSPSPCEHLHPNAAAVQARLAVLYSTGTFAIYELDQSNELRATAITPALVSARLGRVADVEWMPVPPPVGGGTMLAVSLADGTLKLVCTVHAMDIPKQQRLLRFKTVFNFDQGGDVARLAPGVPLASPLLLLRSWLLLLRLLLQRGVPDSLFRDLAVLAASTVPSASGSSSVGKTLEAEKMLERLEGEIWSRLPVACQVAWEQLLARHSEQAESPADAGAVGAASGGGVARILDDFADTAEEDMLSLEEAMATSEAPAAAAGPQSQAASTAAAAGSPSPAGAKRKPPRPSPSSKKKEPVINFKSIGGAFASMATASKSQLGRTFGGSAGGPGGGPASLLQPLGGGAAGGSQGVWDGADAPQTKAAFQCLVTVLQAAGYLRGLPSVLSAAELEAYRQALSRKCTASRMGVAAGLGGDREEQRFWERLPATLQWLRASMVQARSRPISQAEELSPAPGAAAAQQPASSGGGGGGGAPAGLVAGLGAGLGRRPRLWEERKELAAAAERSAWHEQMPRSVFENSEQLQEKRVLQYVSLGDYHTAVGFLLASGPESTARYYRNALCTLAMAFACGTQQTQQAREAAAAAAAAAGGAGRGSSGGGAAAADGGSSRVPDDNPIEDAAARTLFSQAAKVITANSASVGDSLLGVPLLCSTGQHAEAVHLLQESGLWRYAAALTASQLGGSERAAALERWASHMAGAEGRLWSAVGLLVAAGALRSALQMLRQAGLPDAAFALIAACREAEVPVEQHNLDTGELQNLFPAKGQPVRRFTASGEPEEEQGGAAGQPRRSATDYEANVTARDFQQYICDVLQQL